jgi:hypothetical protein
MSADINPFLDEFSSRLLQSLPNGMEPNVDNRLVDIRVSPINKRLITIYIQTQGTRLLKVTYGMPVPESYSRLFRAVAETIPPLQLEFSNHTIRRGYDHIQDLRITEPLWDDEADRLNQVQYDYPAGSAPRKQIANLLRYWRHMKGRIMLALANGGVDTQGERVYQPVLPSSNRRSSRRSSRGATPPVSSRSRRSRRRSSRQTSRNRA